MSGRRPTSGSRPAPLALALAGLLVLALVLGGAAGVRWLRHDAGERAAAPPVRNVTAGWNGPRVAVIQQVVGTWRTGHEATMDQPTIDAVTQWQKDHSLPATGVVDETTWTAMDTGRPWTIDEWTAPSRVPADASRDERIDAMIAFATEQEGSPYLWGGAGPPDLGFDCSGLALQAMRAGGLDPGIDAVTHASPGWLTTHYLLEDPRFTHVPRSELERGDWVFYADEQGELRHMALYLGDGTMVDSYGSGVHVRTYREKIGTKRFAMDTLVRPFP